MSIWTDHTLPSPSTLTRPACSFLCSVCVCVCVCAVIEIFIFHLNCNNKTAEDICLNSRMAAGLNATAQQTSKHTHSHTHALKMPVAYTHQHTLARTVHTKVIVSLLYLSVCRIHFVNLSVCQFAKSFALIMSQNQRVARVLLLHTHTHTLTHMYIHSIHLPPLSLAVHLFSISCKR